MKIAQRKLSPLSLAVLTLLFERPMHPYEMAQTLKNRGKEQSIKLRYGSLYTVIESLERDGLIAPKEISREGKRPERTVFAITEQGRDALEIAMSDLLAQPVKEYPQFEAALSLMPVLPPDRVVPLLKKRLIALKTEQSAVTTGIEEAKRMGLPPLFVVETNYRLATLDAELRFVTQLVADIEGGAWGGLDEWRGFHATREGKPM